MLARYEGAYAASTSSSWATAAGSPGSNPPVYNYIDDAGVREAEEGEGAAERTVRRCRVRPPRLHRPDRPAAGSRRRCGRSSSDTRPTQVKRDEMIDKLVGQRRLTSNTGRTSGPTCCR